MSFLIKQTALVRHFLITCMPLVLVACGGAEQTGDRSLPPPPPAAQCGEGLAVQDLAGLCRSSPPTMGALETPTSSPDSPANTVADKSGNGSLRVTWNPYSGNLSGYMIYYGPSSDSANILASDLSLASGSVDPKAPSASYDPSRDLGLFPGDTACFRIFAYDQARTLSDWSELFCTTV